ncbi:hypothetical protein LI82_03775 [Methanococcoides methylutens]|uniref:Glycosyltransferase RgtA/B/C/D-like domain-containing protein n=1 Tax=Methanococcoides methylutens TaxID=2226 RepID=A0A099T4T7_METMT|nr:hypothetical protein [Methanococcoides methylutens]KGK99158.1 hypothetical protein LI82_03775 [Methanococcoides methylutens]
MLNSIGRFNDKFMFTHRLFLYILPFVGVTGVVIPLLFGQSNLSLLGSYLAIPLILAPFIYVKQSKNENNFTSLDPKTFNLFLSAYFICLFISIILFYTFDVRPLVYYFVISVMASLILLEIVLFDISEKKGIVIIIQMVILSLDLIWGVTLNYNFFIGRTDPMGHAWLIQNAIDNAYITDIFAVYKPFPLWHILCAFVQNILGTSLSTQKIMFFTNGIIYSFVPIISFLICQKIFDNKKIALLAALFVLLNPDVILYGMTSIPRSVSSFLEIVLIFVLLYSNDSKKKLIAIILTFSFIIYHTASVPYVFLILLGIYTLSRIYTQENDKLPFSYNFIILYFGMTLFYWMYYAQGLFEALIGNIVRPAPTGISTASVFFTPLSELFNYLQYTPLLLFVIIGFFATLQSKRICTLGKVFCFLGLLSVSVSFPGPSLLFNRLADNLNFARFGQYSFLFIGLTGAIGFYEIFNKSKKYGKVILLILFISMAFLSVSNDFVASDNPLVKRPFYTFYLTDEEETSFVYIASVTEGYVMSDYVTTRYLSFSKYEDKAHILEVDNKSMNILRNDSDDVFLIRKLELEKRPLRLYSLSGDDFILMPSWGNDLEYYYQDTTLWNELPKYNKIYDSNSVIGFN